MHVREAREGVARGGRGILDGRWVGRREGRPLPGHQGEQLEQRLCSVVRPYCCIRKCTRSQLLVNKAVGGRGSEHASMAKGAPHRIVAWYAALEGPRICAAVTIYSET